MTLVKNKVNESVISIFATEDVLQKYEQQCSTFCLYRVYPENDYEKSLYEFAGLIRANDCQRTSDELKQEDCLKHIL
jgi:hypothetical protein